jgi:hypothetical protein
MRCAARTGCACRRNRALQGRFPPAPPVNKNAIQLYRMAFLFTDRICGNRIAVRYGRGEFFWEFVEAPARFNARKTGEPPCEPCVNIKQALRLLYASRIRAPCQARGGFCGFIAKGFLSASPTETFPLQNQQINAILFLGN